MDRLDRLVRRHSLSQRVHSAEPGVDSAEGGRLPHDRDSRITRSLAGKCLFRKQRIKKARPTTETRSETPRKPGVHRIVRERAPERSNVRRRARSHWQKTVRSRSAPYGPYRITMEVDVHAFLHRLSRGFICDTRGSDSVNRPCGDGSATLKVTPRHARARAFQDQWTD